MSSATIRQLQNQHGIDIAVGETGVTVRRGAKWADAKPGDRLELTTGTKDAQAKAGEGEVVEILTGKFSDIPARLVEFEHEAASRTYSGLLFSMRRAYGPEFDEDETVVVMVYRRTA